MKTFKKALVIINLLLVTSFFAQSQTVAPPPGLRQELRRFYKENKVYNFILPRTSTTSQKLSIYWDSMQVAHYSIKIIKRDSINERSHIAFVPPSTIDTAETATIKPQPKAVKVVTLILHGDGGLTPVNWSNCPCYCWMCGSTPALYNFTAQAWYCPTFPNQPQLVLCGTNGSIGIDVITYISYY